MILAGVTMNVMLAYGVFVVRAAGVGLPVSAATQIDSVDAGDLPPGAEALASLRFGDRLLRINGDTIRNWGDLESGVLHGPAEVADRGRGPRPARAFTWATDRCTTGDASSGP